MSQQFHVFGPCLTDEELIERVFVSRRTFFSMKCMQEKNVLRKDWNIEEAGPFTQIG